MFDDGCHSELESPKIGLVDIILIFVQNMMPKIRYVVQINEMVWHEVIKKKKKPIICDGLNTSQWASSKELLHLLLHFL